MTTNRLRATQTSARTGTGKDEWRTPPELLDAIERRFRVWLAVDAACTRDNRIGPAMAGMYASPTNENGGLDDFWRMWMGMIASRNGRTTPVVWCNPPYSRTADWLAKARTECHQHGVRSVCLVPVRTDTAWWNQSVHRPAHMPYGAARVILLKGRLQFLPPFGANVVAKLSSAPFPSCLVIYEPGHEGPPQYEVWDWRTWLQQRIAANDNGVES